VLLGQPFGAGYERINGAGVLESWAPHNWYVLLYLRIGLIALALLLFLLLGALVRAARTRDGVATAMITALLVFGIAYSVSWFLAPWLALGLAVGMRAHSVTDHKPESGRRVSVRPRDFPLATGFGHRDHA
jgi:O-antigen ligase